MENESLAELKISLVQTIFSLENADEILKIQNFINSLLFPINTENIDHEVELSFSEWNEQFDTNQNLDEFIEDYGMTLGEYRLLVYNSEQEEGISKDEFIEKINRWK
ncbi:MAG TPA: hypothetical protein DCQ31_05405 [Bacteroidales bacterium]|nr:hypothetical protein [Bacteroidales bacterium]